MGSLSQAGPLKSVLPSAAALPKPPSYVRRASYRRWTHVAA